MHGATMTASYLAQLFAGEHELGDEYRLALYLDRGNLGPETRNYAEIGEISGENYQKGGFFLENPSVLEYPDGAQLVFPDYRREVATVEFEFGLVYNASKSNASVAFYDFGRRVFAQNGPLTIPLSQGPLSLLIKT